jgi:hypothetical protein
MSNDFPDTPRGHMQHDKLQRLKAKQDAARGEAPKKKKKARKMATTDDSEA